MNPASSGDMCSQSARVPSQTMPASYSIPFHACHALPGVPSGLHLGPFAVHALSPPPVRVRTQCQPGPSDSVRAIRSSRHPDGTTLQVRTCARHFSAGGAAVSGFSRAAGVMHEQLESSRPYNAFVLRTPRLWWPQPNLPFVISSRHVSPDPSGQRGHRRTCFGRQP
jgi:hypothetical protein